MPANQKQPNDVAEASREETYALLEQKFLTYQDLKSVRVKDNLEPLVSLTNTAIATTIYTQEIRASTGDDILVRETVIKKLIEAQNWLQQRYPNYRLQVFYGYRSPIIQQESFDRIARDLDYKAPFSADQLEAIHRYIAVPDVAGHPTGGAVDVTIIDEHSTPLDMGTPPHSFEKDSYAFSPFINKQSWGNRQLLRTAMMSAEFAPFDGEWWHFSYGDREWAKYWSKYEAIYSAR